ncbi:MAG: PKD domain-containing protein, partial [Thermoplasmatota archaeon]
YDTGLNHWNTSIGNYWDDYTGSDHDGNGIGDIPYLLGGNADHRPLAHVISDPPSYVWVDDDFNASSPGWQIDHFAGIQAGVAAAAPGGTVYVYNGSYGEGLNITVPLTVRGEPGATLAAGQDGVFITASDVELTGLSITAYQNGIKVQQAHNILIHDCHVSQAVFGLYLVHTADCSVTTSSFFGNTKGIYLFNATSTLISGTRIHNNSYFGVELGHGSSGNVLSDCHLADNANYGLYAMHNTADNAVYHNNFINNGAYDAGANVWGGLRREVLGNYWSRHDGPDADHDGMIDHAYAIPGGDAVDWFPLKNRISDSPAFVWVNPGFAPSGPGWSGDHFTSLSEAVAALQTGGGCYVFAGSYHDRVIINQSIWMTGEDPVNTTISGDGGGALVISGGGARVERLGVHDCWNDAGVYISGDDVLLANCSLYDNYYGVYVGGARATVEHCTLRDNSYTGLLGRYATYMTVSNCSIFYNNNGVVLAQVTDSSLAHNTFHNNSLVNLNMREASQRNLVHHNTFAHGIYGVQVHSSTGNWLYLNDFLDNEVQAQDGAANNWDNGSVGNYWSDYDGEDNDYDGIGDTAYAISGGSSTDRYPLMRKAGMPAAYFAYTPSVNLNTQKTITFIDLSVDVDGYLVNWTWDFGDGNTSYLPSPQHRYADNGAYTVTLTVTDNQGNTDVAARVLQVANLPPVVDFTWIPVSPTGLDVIQFIDNSTDRDGSIVNWTWDFGDGNVGYGPTVTHSYATTGVYAVSLTVTDDDGDTGSRQETVTVANAPPTANFGFLPATPSTADSISFTDASVDQDGSIVNWTWDFGDGTVSYQKNPQHSYADNGTYTVTLTVTDDTNNSHTVTLNITVLNDPPTADFTYSPASPVTVNMLAFTDQSVDQDGFIVSWLWEFGDGKTSSKRNPTHTYAVKGTYQVNLTVTDDDGEADTKRISLTVRNTPPVAEFTYLPEEPTDLEEVSFYDQSIDPDGSVSSYAWTFGDGNTSTSRNPSHRYESNGVYSVSLTVTDNDGDTATATRSIVVRNVPPEVNFSYTPAAPTDRDVVRFTATATDEDGTIANYSWTFGDGNRSYGAQVNHTYADDGVYTVTLTVTDDDGDTASHTEEVSIANVKPTASFTFEPDEPKEGEHVTFTDLSTDPDGTIVTATWDFGDGTVEDDGNILNHKYDDAGTYIVTLTVTDDDGDTATASRAIEVKSSDGAAGFDFVLLVAALGMLLVMWRSGRGLWRRRPR